MELNRFYRGKVLPSLRIVTKLWLLNCCPNKFFDDLSFCELLVTLLVRVINVPYFLSGLLVDPLLLFFITLLNESVASMAGARLTEDVMKIRGVRGPLSSAFLAPLKVILTYIL